MADPQGGASATGQEGDLHRPRERRHVKPRGRLPASGSAPPPSPGLLPSCFAKQTPCRFNSLRVSPKLCPWGRREWGAPHHREEQFSS